MSLCYLNDMQKQCECESCVWTQAIVSTGLPMPQLLCRVCLPAEGDTEEPVQTCRPTAFCTDTDRRRQRKAQGVSAPEAGPAGLPGDRWYGLVSYLGTSAAATHIVTVGEPVPTLHTEK